MATIKLTDKAVAAAKAPPGKRLELWDEQTPGLCLRVSDSGKKVWVWRYRTLDGRQPRLTLGDYSAKHGLRWARDEIEDLRVVVRRGADPAADRKKAKASARSEKIRTFDDLADAYLAACKSGEWKPKNKKKRDSTLKDETGILKRHIRPALGALRLEDVTRPTIRKLLRSMLERGINAQTNKVHAIIRQCFAYAMSEERVASNPALGISAPAEQKARVRVLSDAELKTLWAALIDTAGLLQPAKDGEKPAPVGVTRPVRIALQLATLLLVRRGEVAGMRVDELDLPQATWLIPGERMKGGLPHLVPLPPQAITLINEALSLRTDKKGPCVFPSPRSVEKSVLGNSVTHAMKEITTALDIEGVAPHDLRRTASTLMTSERLRITPFIRSKVLAHRGDTGGGAAVSMLHYDANDYATEKRRALEAWEALLMEIVTGKPRASNIQSLKGAVA